MKKNLFPAFLLFYIATAALAQTSGSFDANFGTAGFTTTDFPAVANSTSWLIAQPDGKLIVLGNVQKNLTNTNILALRYTADGILDASFGSSGIYNEETFSPALSSVQYREVWTGAVLADGKILLAGIVQATSGSYQFLIRLNPNGVRDATFGNNGIALVEVVNNAEPRARPVSIALLGDGKILMFSGNYSNTQFTLIRFTAAGALDTSFGNAGILPVVSSVPSIFSLQAQALALLPDGKILAQAVSSKPPNTGQMHIFRFMPDGTPDNTFSADGEVITAGNPSALTTHNKIGLLPDGKFLVGRYTSMSRFNANGTQDNTFGTNGTATLALNTNSFIVQSDGKIVGASAVSSRATLYRLNPNGSADNTWNSTGIAGASDAVPQNSGFTNVVQQPDGKIVACGSKTGDYLIARYFSQTISGTKDQRNILEQVSVGPNPTRDVTQISFYIPESQTMSMHVANSMGQLVRTLERGVLLQRGEHIRTVDLSGLPTGHYFLMCKSNKGEQSFKICLAD